jgi:hypothetical protein
MPDPVPQAAPAAAPAAAEPAPTNAIEARARRHNAVVNRESVADAMARLEAAGVGADEDTEAEAEPEAKPSLPAAKPGKKTVTPEGKDRMAELNRLAKELGLSVDAGSVLPSERAEFREFKRKQSETLAQREKEALTKLEAREKEATERLSRAERAEKVLRALENDDFDSIASAAGYKDWDDVTGRYAAKLTDPNYKEVREIKRKLEESEREKKETAERAEREKKEIETRTQQQERQRQHVAYLTRLASELPQSKDPLVAAMGDHPLFTNAILKIQQDNFDGTEPLAAERAVGMASKGAKVTLREECEDLYRRLAKVFGKQEAAPAKAKPAPKSAPVPPSAGMESSGARTMSRKERDAYERRRLMEAAELEMTERRRA